MLHQSFFVPSLEPELTRQVAEWAKIRGVNARLDFMAGGQIPAKLASEAEAKTGHDIFWLRAVDSALYKNQLATLDDVAVAVEKDSGPWLEPARYLAEFDGHWYGVPWYYWSFPATINTKYWSQIRMGTDNVAALSWEGLGEAAVELQRIGHPVAFAISETPDSNDILYPLLWSFGGRTVDERGSVVLDSNETAQAVEFVKRLFTHMPREVLGWDDGSNNRYLLSGIGSWSNNPPSIWASARLNKLPIAEEFDHVPLPRGPKGRFRTCGSYTCGVWKFSQNIDLAKDLIRYLLRPENFRKQVEASMGYNQPLLKKFRDIPYWRQERTLRYYEPPKEQITMAGWPGPRGPGAVKTYTLSIIPIMFAKAATGQMPTAAAIKWAADQIRQQYGTT
jgi:multiple sugar transport system substrate-binding protein